MLAAWMVVWLAMLTGDMMAAEMGVQLVAWMADVMAGWMVRS
jgi:hypothetical protein